METALFCDGASAAYGCAVRRAEAVRFGAYFTVVTDHLDAVKGEFAKLFGLEASDIANHPHCLIGPVEELVEKIQRRREELGINYVTFGGAVIDDVAPIVEALSGT